MKLLRYRLKLIRLREWYATQWERPYYSLLRGRAHEQLTRWQHVLRHAGLCIFFLFAPYHRIFYRHRCKSRGGRRIIGRTRTTVRCYPVGLHLMSRWSEK